MPDGNGFTLFASAAEGQLQLLADSRDFGHIIEEWDIPEAGADSEFLRRFKRHGGRSRAAIDVEEMPVAQDRHELGHELRIGGGLRTLVIVDAGYTGNILKELLDQRGNIRSLHARMQFLRFRVFVRNGLHGQMEQDLKAAAFSFGGDFNGMLVIRQDGDGQGVRKSKDCIGGGAVAPQIVEDDRQPWTRRLARGAIGSRGIPRTGVNVNRVRSYARFQIKKQNSFAAFGRLLRQTLASCRRTEGLLDFRDLGTGRGVRCI